MSHEYLISATLEAKTALHIGTGQAGSVTDSPVRRDADGRFLIPGRALGGSLRTLATRLAPRLGLRACQILQKNPNVELPCDCEVCDLFGNVYPVDPETTSTVTSKASQLWVYDAVAKRNKRNKRNSRTHIRDGVGIDRKTGVASSQVKFNYETIPPQTQFLWHMRLAAHDDATINENILVLLAVALAEWEAGRGQIGGNVARGLGHFTLTTPTVKKLAIQDADQLINYLYDDKPDTFIVDINWAAKLEKGRTQIIPLPDSVDEQKQWRSQSIGGSFLKIDFTLAFADLFLSHDPIAGLISGFDHAPLLEFIAAPGSVGPPVLSGSSLRGVLRSHAEKIARTLATNHWVKRSQVDARTNFLRHCPACDVLAKAGALTSCDTRLKLSDQKETPEKALCWSCRLFGSQRRGSRLWVRDAAVKTANLSKEDWKVQDFLAIDRFTGGGLHGAKFDVASLSGLAFSGQIMLSNPADWELGWLSLLLRDLVDGRLTVGFGKAKGYGHAIAKDLIWTVGYLHEGDRNLFPLTKTDNISRKGIYLTSQHNTTETDWLPSGWQTQAQKWVGQFNEFIVRTDLKDNDHWQDFSQDSFFTEDNQPDFLALYGVSKVEVNDVN